MSQPEIQEEIGPISAEEIQEAAAVGQQQICEMLNSALLEAYCPHQNPIDGELTKKEENLAMFLLSVLLPVYFKHGIPHDELYRKAVEEHNFDSVLDLIQVNPVARQLPGIAEMLKEMSRSNETDKLDLINESLRKFPRHLGRNSVPMSNGASWRF